MTITNTRARASRLPRHVLDLADAKRQEHSEFDHINLGDLIDLASRGDETECFLWSKEEQAVRVANLPPVEQTAELVKTTIDAIAAIYAEMDDKDYQLRRVAALFIRPALQANGWYHSRRAITDFYIGRALPADTKEGMARGTQVSNAIHILSKFSEVEAASLAEAMQKEIEARSTAAAHAEVAAAAAHELEQYGISPVPTTVGNAVSNGVAAMLRDPTKLADYASALND